MELRFFVMNYLVWLFIVTTSLDYLSGDVNHHSSTSFFVLSDFKVEKCPDDKIFHDSLITISKAFTEGCS